MDEKLEPKKQKRNPKNELFFLIMNICVPLVTGSFIYYFISPNVIFVKAIDKVVGRTLHIGNSVSSYFIIQLVRNYWMDFLWGYSLIFALYLIFDKKTAELLKIFLTAFIFSVVMEFLQITPIAKGTFDIWDIFVELLAEVMAVLIIKKYSRRNVVYEKKH